MLLADATSNDRGVVVAVMAAATLIRLVMAARVPLAPDEAYYWIWSHALASGYLDHPPMVALWISAGTALLGQTSFGIRLLGPLAAALASWLLYDTARVLFPGTRAGIAAVMLLNASLLLGVGTVIMTPDSPLLFFWTATLWAMAHVAKGGSGIWWLVAGVSAGLALDSKYTGLFLWIGVGLWLVLVPDARTWLRRWQPWAATVIGLALFAPVVAWNRAHNWVGLIRQGGRIEDWRPARALTFLAELAGGQAGLLTPIVWLMCMAGLLTAADRAWRSRDPAWSLLVALSLPPVLVFLQHALGDRVQANWPAIIYPALCVAAGGATAERRWWIGASALGFVITALVYIQAGTHFITLPSHLDPIALRLAGWGMFADQIEVARRTDGAGFITADGYTLLSELAWKLPGNVPVAGVDARWRLLNLPHARIVGTTGILVQKSNRADPPDPLLWEHAERVGTAARPGSGDISFVLYRVKPRQEIQAVTLPRP